jgi:6-phosphogluconolactonase
MTKQHTVYFGTYTGPQSKGIYRSILDGETGRLSVPELVAEASSPSFLALSPDGCCLYAALEADGGAVGAWKIGDDDRFTALNQRPSGDGACHVQVDAAGKNVLAANYGDGSIACFPLRDDGSLKERSALARHTGNGPNPQRQDKPHAHSVYTDPTDTFVYACDLGTDEVKIYRFDAATGTLTPNDPPAARVPPGAGPRHFALHPGGFAYANNEMGSSVTVFGRDAATGALTAIETVPTLPKGADREGNLTAEMFIHPTGNWLYVSNRGHDTIAVYAIGADGTLTVLEYCPTPREPRGFGISPDGQWLVVGGQKDDTVAALRIDPATGKLKATGQTVEVGAPVCVLFAPPRAV